ncbi:hypothetical protein [Haloferula helveola]
MTLPDRIIRTLSAVPLGALLAMGWLTAQESPSATYRITSFGTGEAAEHRYSNTPGGDAVEVFRAHVSNPVKAKLREGEFLDFFEEGGEEPVFSLSVPAGNRSDLLVLLIEEEGKVKPVLLDLKELRLEPGGQFVYNLLSVPVAVQCGEKSRPVFVRPGKSASIPPPKEDKVVQSVFYEGSEGKPVEFSSSLYFKDEGARHLLFCHGKAGDKRPKLTPVAIYQQQEEKNDGR